jgi:hypothetical protein
MFRNNAFWRILLALLLVVALVIVGYGVYRLGYAQGYQSARVAINGGGRTGIRPLPFFGGLPYYGFGSGIRFPFYFSFFVPFFWIGVFLLIFFIIRALIRPWSGLRSASSVGPSGTGINPSGPGAMGSNSADAGPYDPYHMRDNQGSNVDQPVTSGGPGPTPSQP